MRLFDLFSVACRRWLCLPSGQVVGRDRRGWALARLALVQLGERFAFVALLPSFVRYLQGHQGLSEKSALLCFGLFQALSYLAALPAGMIADRRLGAARAALLGCTLLVMGYGALVLDHSALLWPALALLVAGHGFFKPGLNTLANSLFPDSDRERAALLLYLAANVGGMAGPLCAERLRVAADWGGLFRMAAVAMLGCAVLLALGSPSRISSSSRFNLSASGPSSADTDRERLRAVWLVCGVALVFWLTAQQAASSLTLFAEAHTVDHLSLGTMRLPVGPGRFTALHSALVLLLIPLFSWFESAVRKGAATASAPAKMIGGYVVTAMAFGVMGLGCLLGRRSERIGAGWLGLCYVLLSGAELILAPLGLSLVARLTPPHRASQTVGLWFGSVAVGMGLAGVIGLLWVRWSGMVGHAQYFALLAALSLGAGALLLAHLRRLERLLG